MDCMNEKPENLTCRALKCFSFRTANHGFQERGDYHSKLLTRDESRFVGDKEWQQGGDYLKQTSTVVSNEPLPV